MTEHTKTLSSHKDALARVIYALSNGTTTAYPLSINDDGNLKVIDMGKLVPNEHDEIYLTYTSDNLTGVAYSHSSATVATLTLSYDSDDNLTKVVKA